MADTSNLTEFLQDVADAIKEKKEYASSTKIPAADFDTEIASIDTVKGETVTINPSTSQQVVTPSTGKNAITRVTVPAVTSSIDANITQANIKAGVSILGVEGNLEPDKPDQTKTITPSTSQQTVTPDAGYELSSVTVNAVTSDIDADIVASNIKKDVNILGVTGTYEGTVINNQDKIVSPSTSQQVVGSDSGYTGLGQVTINAVTSSIDSNIQAGNIKKDITILGVTGTHEGGTDTSDATAYPNDIASDVTAYARGEKITGTLPTFNRNEVYSLVESENTDITTGVSNVQINGKFGGDRLMRTGSKAQTTVSNGDLATAINLTPDILKSGENILGVVGNYSGGSTENLENVISEQENIIANLSNIVNSKAGTGFIVPNGTKFGFSTYNEFPNTWDFSQVQDASGMFASCYNLTNVPDMSHCNLQGFTSLMFRECGSLVNAPNLNLTNITEANEMFSGCTQLSNIPEYDTSNMSAMTYMFTGCHNLITTPNLNTSNCNRIWGMFMQCSNLVNVLQYDTSNVNEQMGQMFMECNNLSDASIQNIINMCLNSNITDSAAKTLVLDDWNSPFVQSNISNTRYQNRWDELTAAGWTY